MASLVEFQDMQFSNRHHHDLLQAIPESCESYDMHTLEELMPEPLPPTPPLSPEHTSSSSVSSPSSSQYSYEMDVLEFGEALLNDLFESEQISCDGESLSGDNYTTNFLIQDCMWNCSSYEPRNGNGVYTPAPSPPPPKEQMEKTEDKAPNSVPVKEEANTVQADCISPVDVFPSCHLFMPQEELSQDLKVAKMKPKKLVDRKTTKENHKTVLTRSMSVSSCRPRFQPQATTSESDEEIDVVTVSDRTERPITRMNTRKRLVSVSAPTSRHTSPTPSSPMKKRKYHTKRLQRLSSAGSSNFEGTESDDEQRRASHNILERKRRNDLKYSFQVLRGQIPELEDNQRAPKVTILRKAAEYIRQIREREDKMDLEFEKEKKREVKLRQRLAQLKSTPLMR